MAWEWSHTQEGIENARQNVARLSKKVLLEILREWAYHNSEERSFRLAFNGRKCSKDELASSVWMKMENLRTCDNGGFRAWCCPYGCHTVSFDCEKEVPSGVN